MSTAPRSIGRCALPFVLPFLACTPIQTEPCPIENEEATLDVHGAYRYSGGGTNEMTGISFELSGTISFANNDGMVRVSDTTYDFSGLRRLESEAAAMHGNRLDLVLTPQNGDEDYHAAVTFIFSDDGDRFCVQFSDANSDMGALGSFRGVKEAD